MPDIRYVCISDMHLGADNSVLTPIKPNSIEVDTSQPSALMIQLVNCLRELIAHNEGPEKPTLVLNGDILEMALTNTNKAAMVFERFIELIFPKEGEALFNKHMLYLPGNHDHHIWESARETQYLQFISRIQPGGELPPPWHTTKMFHPDLVLERFLTGLVRRYPHLSDATVNVIYPNYALVDNDGQKCLIFSHGHYVESIYSLMSTLNTMFFPDRKKPKVIWEVEAENFAWVDFFFSTVGRSGDVGQDIGIFYAKLQEKLQFDRLIANFINSYLERKDRFKLVEGIEERGLKWIVEFILGKFSPLEKQRTASVLSSDAQQGLQSFMEGPLLEQILIENMQRVPTDITFVFGHTHKPFQQEITFAGYPAPLKVYNDGGWVVDKLQISPIHGAAVILVDETLQAVSLRMYNQAPDVEDYAVNVEELVQAGETSSIFYDHINALVDPAHDPWKSFSVAVAEAVGVHTQVLQAKINL